MDCRHWLWSCAVVGLLPGVAQAITVPTVYQHTSSLFGIPRGLLYAIALTESGRQPFNGQIQPWPWTLNVAGTAHYYPTRRAACRALRRLIAKGRRSIDIGVMQINWRWHHVQFPTPCRALSPNVNLRVAARLLRRRDRQSGDWWLAVGRYHDPGQDRVSVAAACVIGHGCWATGGRCPAQKPT